MKVTTEGKIPIKCWATDVEESAMVQAQNLSNLPFAFKHVALMSDCHKGFGMPIGGVLATNGVVIPNAVGVDIFCGVIALKTTLEHLTTDQIKTAMGKIREVIPVGYDHHKEAQEWDGFRVAPDIKIIQQELNASKKQLGTLGSGNHFCEIQKGDDGYIWIMIHSGSRNFGYRIAKEYNKKAQELCARWFSNIPEFKGENGLAFLPIEEPVAKEYMEAMNYAGSFAQASRFKMMERVVDILGTNFDNYGDAYNVSHNYCRWENHFGKNVLVHRKGATSAQAGQVGVIPGSQGTSSYIVEGLGNPESFNSCSHGAGRAMGRKQAKRTLNLEDELKKMEGVVHGIRSTNDLDEAPGSYKDIDVVMENQKDLVKIVTKLKPLGVIKG